MNRVLIGIAFIIGIATFGCKTTNKKSVSADGKFEYYGEKIAEDKPISVDKLIDKLNSDAEYIGQVTGQVESVCLVKGCWMNVVSVDGNEVFVKFKDYGFFMPMDLDGETVIMRGRGYKEVTTVDELRHYAEDEGKSQEEIEKITEPAEELKFMADGVILVRG